MSEGGPSTRSVGGFPQRASFMGVLLGVLRSALIAGGRREVTAIRVPLITVCVHDTVPMMNDRDGAVAIASHDLRCRSDPPAQSSLSAMEPDRTPTADTKPRSSVLVTSSIVTTSLPGGLRAAQTSFSPHRLTAFFMILVLQGQAFCLQA